MSSKRILFIPAWYPNKVQLQAGNFIQSLAVDLAERGIHIDVWYPHLHHKYTSPATVEEYTEGNLTEYRHYRWFPPKVGSVIHNRWKKAILQKAKQHLSDSYDIVHTHGYIASFLGTAFARHYQSKYVASYHHHHIIEHNISSYRKVLLTKECKSADKVIVPSSAMQEGLGMLTGRTDAEIIPNYIDISDIEMKSHDSSSSTIRCVCVASLVNVKNVGDLLDQWTSLAEKYTLDVIGDGPLHNSLTDTINNLGLSNRVRLLPEMPRNTLLEKYQSYDIFVGMSTTETFGMSMLEAIAAGLPVVTTTDSGPRDFVNEQNGIITDSAGFVDSVVQVADRLSKYTPENVRKSVLHYSGEVVLPQYISLYENL